MDKLTYALNRYVPESLESRHPHSARWKNTSTTNEYLSYSIVSCVLKDFLHVCGEHSTTVCNRVNKAQRMSTSERLRTKPAIFLSRRSNQGCGVGGFWKESESDFFSTPTPDVQLHHFYITILSWEFLLKWYNFFETFV